MPITPGLSSGLPTLCRVRIDEADDLDAELVAARVQLARQVDGAWPVPTSSSRSRGPSAR